MPAGQADLVPAAHARNEAANEPIARYLTRLGPHRLGQTMGPRCALIRADRTTLTDMPPGAEPSSPLATREPLPRDLGLALHAAEGSPDALLNERFRLFLDCLSRFSPLVGQGRWRLRDGGLQLAFGTNARDADHRLIELCNATNR